MRTMWTKEEGAVVLELHDYSEMTEATNFLERKACMAHSSGGLSTRLVVPSGLVCDKESAWKKDHMTNQEAEMVVGAKPVLL